MQGNVTSRPTQYFKRQPRTLAIGAGGNTPPIRFNRIKNTDAEIFTNDLLDNQLFSARFSRSGFADYRNVVFEGFCRDNHCALAESDSEASSSAITPSRSLIPDS